MNKTIEYAVEFFWSYVSFMFCFITVPIWIIPLTIYYLIKKQNELKNQTRS